MNLICFDLEGPLAPQDNAYELMQLFPHSSKIFEVISRYDQCDSYDLFREVAKIVKKVLKHEVCMLRPRRSFVTTG